MRRITNQEVAALRLSAAKQMRQQPNGCNGIGRRSQASKCSCLTRSGLEIPKSSCVGVGRVCSINVILACRTCTSSCCRRCSLLSLPRRSSPNCWPLAARRELAAARRALAALPGSGRPGVLQRQGPDEGQGDSSMARGHYLWPRDSS